ncbi:MAG: hypothetical protein FWF76_07335 [Oscillospiraceae bacterium]|nr:hypothetical protein [Oscillospiraceae bacterium]
MYIFRDVRFFHTFLHEIGHSLTLLDVSCGLLQSNFCGNSVMRQGFPTVAGGPLFVSHTVTASDAANLRRSL